MNSGGQLARFTENVQNFMITPEFLSQASKLVNRPFSLGHNEPVVAAKWTNIYPCVWLICIHSNESSLPYFLSFDK